MAGISASGRPAKATHWPLKPLPIAQVKPCGVARIACQCSSHPGKQSWRPH